MRKTFFPVCIIIALMSLSLIPMSRGFQTGPGSSPTDKRYEGFGPRASTLLMKVYADYAGEFAALMNNQIDAMDTNLQPTDIWTVQNDSTKTTGFVLNYGLQEYDMNCYVAPFNNTSFRQGLSCLVDREDFVNTYFPGGSSPAYTPLESQGAWANPAEFGLYPEKDYVTAFEYFMASGYPLIEDPNRPGYSTWDFPNPYPTTNSSSPAGGSGPAVPQDELLMYVRTEVPDRWGQGIYMTDVCMNKFPAAIEAIGNDTLYTLTGYKLPLGIDGNPLWPELHIMEIDTTRATTSVQVMKYYRFHIYTGAWITSSTPDFLVVWQNYYMPSESGWGANAYDYSSFDDADFTTDVDNLLAAPVIGTPGTTNTSEAMYWSYAAQDRLMQLAALIPFYVYAGWSATQTNTYNMINQMGTGFGNWYSFFDAYHEGVTTGDTLKWGWSIGLQNPNPFSSGWASDWYYLGEIYDSLLSLNPYDVTDFHPSIADGWSVTPLNEFGNTEVTLHIREDIMWQDLPYKDRSAYTLDFGHELDGPIQNVQLTPLDVAFTFEYILANKLAFKQACYDLYYNIADADHVVLNPIWESAWPWSNINSTDGDPPWYNSTYAMSLDSGLTRHSWQNFYIGMNFVRFDPSIDQNSIKIVLNDPSPWYVYYSDMVSIVLPMHIFEWLAEGPWIRNGVAVPNVFTMNMMPNGADILYGSGPYIGLGQADPQTYIMIAYATGASYEGVTTQNSYFAFRVHDLAAVNVIPTQRLVLPGNGINITVQVKNQGEFPETSNVTLYAGSTLLGVHYGVFLEQGELETFAFSWNTTAFSPGCYFLKASIAPVLHEVDLGNNNDINGTVVIAAETPTGTNVTVSPSSNAQVTFTETTTTGITTLNVTQPPSTALTGAANSVFVDIKTNATYSGSVTLQFAYNPTGLTLEDEKAMRMWLWNQTSGRWVDITTSVDTDNNIVYGESPHLSMFGITCTLGLTDNNGYQIPTTVGTPPSPPPLPDYLEDLAYFDIQATAQYASPVFVRLAYDPSTISQEQAPFLQMWVWNGIMWVDITTKVDTISHVIYGVSPHLSMFGITTFNPQVITGATPIAGIAGISGYKLLFKETVGNPFGSPASVDYYWSFSVEKWSGTQWIATAISGSSPVFTGYFIPTLATLDLPYYVYLLPSSGSNAVAWNDWLRVSYAFHWTCSGVSYSIDYSAKLHVHPPDIAGGTNTAPYYASDGNVGPPDLGVISPNWKKSVPGGTDPTSNLARADIDGDNYIGPSDLGRLSARWKQTWTNTPPPG